MKLKFFIEYCVSEGEHLKVSGVFDGSPFSLLLCCQDKKNWTGEIDFEISQNQNFSSPVKLAYSYSVVLDAKVLSKEWGSNPHKISLDKSVAINYLYDSWQWLPENEYLYSSAYETAFFSRVKEKENQTQYHQTLRISAKIPQIKKNQKLFICGNWINWDLQMAVMLFEIAPNLWSVSLDIKTIDFPFEFKFVIYDRTQNNYFWQENNNFVIAHPDLTDEKTLIAINNFNPVLPFDHPKVAGIIMPVSALRTKRSFGVGDFGDIKAIVDWAAECEMRVIQTLPINDTSSGGSWMDASPYNVISVFALHPIYIDLNQLPIEKNDDYFKEQEKLNAADAFDYEIVNSAKRRYARNAFKKEGEQIFASQSFKDFFKKNSHWLIPYAAFSYLRDQNNTTDFSKWESHNTFNQQEIQALCTPTNPAFKDLSFYFYLQFHLHNQLLNSANYARQKGIILKGDIPIGISPCSVDTWQYPQYFNMDTCAGAPPDIFSLTGQNWGFPTYNWQNIAKDNYSWWSARLKQMALYFDAYRIDHILGFFRIWQIPKTCVYGLLGQFAPALGLTKEEIKEYDFEFDPDYLKPLITDELLIEKFGELASEVKKKYLITKQTGIYEFLADYDTQKKVEAAFYDKNDEESTFIKEGLYSLLSDVLFLEDASEKNLYHPRILAETNFAFKQLSKDQQKAYTNLYNYYFYQRHNDFWYERSLKILPIIKQSTKMLVCAEDLGMIPECVPQVLKELQILSLEVERYPKKSGEVFANVRNYPFLSVCCISTHDTSTFRGFWKEDEEKTKRFCEIVLAQQGTPPDEASGQICRQVLQNSLESPSMICMFLFQDWISIDENLRKPNIDSERINVPGAPHESWRYRMHLNIEDLINERDLINNIKDLIKTSSR
jgi:4-alpha-glucanotransferase